jgi:hypothetical protein
MSKWTCLLAILAVTLLFAGAGWAASVTLQPAATTSVAASDDGWRRTADGWERAEQFLPTQTAAPCDYPARRFHPALLASLQILLGAGALLLANRNSAAEREIAA